jgi:hypothetical protein
LGERVAEAEGVASAPAFHADELPLHGLLEHAYHTLVVHAGRVGQDAPIESPAQEGGQSEHRRGFFTQLRQPAAHRLAESQRHQPRQALAVRRLPVLAGLGELTGGQPLGQEILNQQRQAFSRGHQRLPNRLGDGSRAQAGFGHAHHRLLVQARHVQQAHDPAGGQRVGGRRLVRAQRAEQHERLH